MKPFGWHTCFISSIIVLGVTILIKYVIISDLHNRFSFQDDLSDDYANDVGEEWDPIEDEISSTTKPALGLGVNPSAFTRLDGYRQKIVSAVDPIAATNERPRILDDCKFLSAFNVLRLDYLKRSEVKAIPKI